MKKTYTVSFKVETEYKNLPTSLQALEFELKDLIQIAVLPTLNLELTPLTFTIKNARG